MGICVSRDDAFEHLTVDGFIPGYTHGIAHGELPSIFQLGVKINVILWAMMMCKVQFMMPLEFQMKMDIQKNMQDKSWGRINQGMPYDNYEQLSQTVGHMVAWLRSLVTPTAN
ncbi:hypothetical protein SASPL_141263 [Salvia splendens]|uniref:Uncharacterized protein n=1 Tax=Salvia splendens TaxID=180675 RepID=A0A8X8ZCP6_SALSN|nr:hypothetical protein SASPL_141263 [Salvia splendens]